tara:strand:- start:211407 stop:212711 length:1305 start_codon:yes stop_codon:yes gene_type:complete
MYHLYRIATYLSADWLLKNRLAKGKEDAGRIAERRGEASIKRPEGNLIWMHGASVGEVVSLLTLITKLRAHDPSLNVLLTSGTLTSAALIKQRGLDGVIHQYIPLDHPSWVARFLNHWAPNAAIIAESEIWPNLMMEIGQRKIAALLINARLSEKSYKGWRKLRGIISKLLSSFDVILTQTPADKLRFEDLGHKNVVACGNIKYSAAPLRVSAASLSSLSHKFKNRRLWVYASSHEGEELLACSIHQKLKAHIPELLTIIVPRHPERRADIAKSCDSEEYNLILRSAMSAPPADLDIYVVDTLGELGLFYHMAEITVIGRTFSADGGGGHNPIEAAQLNCAILHGPLYQNLQEIFDEMHTHNAALMAETAEALYNKLLMLFNDDPQRESLQKNALAYTQSKDHILDQAFAHIIKILPAPVSVDDGSSASAQDKA